MSGSATAFLAPVGNHLGEIGLHVAVGLFDASEMLGIGRMVAHDVDGGSPTVELLGICEGNAENGAHDQAGIVGDGIGNEVARTALGQAVQQIMEDGAHLGLEQGHHPRPERLQHQAPHPYQRLARLARDAATGLVEEVGTLLLGDGIENPDERRALLDLAGPLVAQDRVAIA
jgi:hypothetical protein